uniref:DUF4371 domain-containing protein n=1 Tax=Amphimedon queenslandica TaxID=400682 RepID=A0A1X7TYS0_AMPQE
MCIASAVSSMHIEARQKLCQCEKALRGIGTDGASTMIGCHNSVVAQLKQINNSATEVHCAAHRLNLASSQAAGAVPYVKKFQSIICQLYDFCDNSAVPMATLKLYSYY